MSFIRETHPLILGTATEYDDSLDSMILFEYYVIHQNLKTFLLIPRH